MSREIEVSGQEVDDVDEVPGRAESAGLVFGHAQDAFGYGAGDSANGSETPSWWRRPEVGDLVFENAGAVDATIRAFQGQGLALGGRPVPGILQKDEAQTFECLASFGIRLCPLFFAHLIDSVVESFHDVAATRWGGSRRQPGRMGRTEITVRKR